MSKDWYDTLGVSRAATLTEVKQAFRKKASVLHPDQGGNAKDFIELQKAYEKAISAVKNNKKPEVSSRAWTGRYDPFTDLEYDHRVFFQPDSPQTEGFERSMRAKGCTICRGMGKITKNVHPEKGFMGRETRLCRCQWQ